nr:Acidic repeat containing protein [Hymenolepis microstoma]
MSKALPGIPRDLFTSESDNDESNSEEIQNSELLACSNTMLTDESDESKSVSNIDYLSRCTSADKKLENNLSAPGSDCPIYSINYKSDAGEKTGNVCYSIFSSSSASPVNSPAPSHLPHSTPLVNLKSSVTHKKSSSLRQHFRNLSLRIFSEDCDDEECSKPSSPVSEIDKKLIKVNNESDHIKIPINGVNDAGFDSDSFEALMARLRVSPASPKKPEPVHGDSSFIVSDSVSSDSESSEDLNFYRRLENQSLRKSLKEVMKVRRRVRVESSSSESSIKQKVEEEEESTEITKPDTSEYKESNHRPGKGEIPPPKLLPPHRTKGSQQPKITSSDLLKEIGNECQGDDVYSTLPFIYSLDSVEKPSSSKFRRRRHPSAERFVKNFKKNREELANRLYSFYNEIVFDNKLPKDLKVQWNERLLKTAGQCIYMKRKVKNPDGTFTVSNEVKIELSGKVCTSAERVRDTLLHETCHAAVWMVHGVNGTHGRLWRAFVQRANSTFPDLPPITVRHTYAIEARYTYRCTGCFITINRHSKSLDIQRKICRRCKSRFQLFVNKNGKMIPVETSQSPQSSTQPGVQMTPRKPLFAEFVKEHYKEIRGVVSSHKDAMTQLGSLFRSLRIDPDKENQ